jgi:hypothetical protein
MGNRAEALGLLAELLASHAHNTDIVKRASRILFDCGASDQARGVCDEYLTTNPHDMEIRTFRNSLEFA